MSFEPTKWVMVANHNRPPLPGVTPWFDGTTVPTRPGWYERYFTNSLIIGDYSMQWWDGKCWRATLGRPPHWRQQGDYPAWRGITEERARIIACAEHALSVKTPNGG